MCVASYREGRVGCTYHRNRRRSREDPHEDGSEQRGDGSWSVLTMESGEDALVVDLTSVRGCPHTGVQRMHSAKTLLTS